MEQLTLELPDSHGIVDDQDPLRSLRPAHEMLEVHPGQPPPHQHVVDRQDEILDIDDEHRIAILQQRRAVDVGDLPEPSIEGPDLEIPLPEEGVDDHAELLAAVADDDDRHRGARATAGSGAEDLFGHHQPD